MAAIEESYIRDTSAQDVALDPAPLARKRRLVIGGLAAIGLILIIAVAMLIRGWLSTSLVVPRERLRIATVTRGAFVRDVSAQGTVVVADSPTLFSSGVGTVTFLVKAGDAVKEGQALDLKVLEVDPIHHRIVLAVVGYPDEPIIPPVKPVSEESKAE